MGAFLFTQSALCQVLNIEVSDYGWLDSLPILKPLLDDYVQEVETDLNRDQPIKDPQRLMKGAANSAALAGRGIGTDYSSTFDKFIGGLSVSGAVDAQKDAGLEDEISGVGGSAVLIVGKKLDEKLDGFIHIGGASSGKTFPGIEGTDLLTKINSFNLGVMLRYRLINGSGDDFLGWGGLRAHFGYQFIRNEIYLENELDENLELDTGFGILNGRIQGVPQYTIRTRIHSFPLELSSNVNLLKFIGLFGGVGLDLNFGKAIGTGDIKADVTPLFCSGGFCSNLNLPELEASANLDAEEKVDPLTLRGFAGLELKFPHFKIFGQVNKTVGDEVLGAMLGTRVVF